MSKTGQFHRISISVRTTPARHTLLAQAAKLTGKSMQQLMDEAVAAYTTKILEGRT